MDIPFSLSQGKWTMPYDIEAIARLLGAKIVGQIPDVGGGPPAAVYLAKVYQARMEALRGAGPSSRPRPGPARTP
jgi:hypothetical protein